MTVEKTVRRVGKLWVIDKTSDGKYNLLELAGNYDVTKGLPPGGGNWFDTFDAADKALQARVKSAEAAPQE